jgi:hypothetical protein
VSTRLGASLPENGKSWLPERHASIIDDEKILRQEAAVS